MQTVTSHGVQLELACTTNAQETVNALKAKLKEMPPRSEIGGLLIEVTETAAQHYGLDPFITVKARLGDNGLEFVALGDTTFWPNVVIGVFATRNTVLDEIVQPELDLSSVFAVEHEPLPVVAEEEQVAEEPAVVEVEMTVTPQQAPKPISVAFQAPSKQQQQQHERQQQQKNRKG